MADQFDLNGLSDPQLEELVESVHDEQHRRQQVDRIQPLENIDWAFVLDIAKQELEEELTSEQERDDRYFVEAVMHTVFGKGVYKKIRELRNE